MKAYESKKITMTSKRWYSQCPSNISPKNHPDKQAQNNLQLHTNQKHKEQKKRKTFYVFQIFIQPFFQFWSDLKSTWGSVPLCISHKTLLLRLIFKNCSLSRTTQRMICLRSKVIVDSNFNFKVTPNDLQIFALKKREWNMIDFLQNSFKLKISRVDEEKYSRSCFSRRVFLSWRIWVYIHPITFP